METTHVSETSTLYIHTPGDYPKEDNIRFSQHGESLKTKQEHGYTSSANGHACVVTLKCNKTAAFALNKHKYLLQTIWDRY
jgi:hypothetical protein